MYPRVSVDLKIDREGGEKYYLEGFKATVYDVDDPDKIKSHYFKLDRENPITSRMSYNLLSGRSVKIGSDQNKHWIQLDFNDRDTHGNYRVKRFYPGYGYDFEAILRRLSIKEFRYPEQTRQLLCDLKRGELKHVTLIDARGQRQITVVANPQFKSLNLFDSKGKKISLATILNGRKKIKKSFNKKSDLHKEEAKRNSLKL